MTGFNSHDELVSEMTTAGKFFRTDWMKNLHSIGTVVAGRWYDTTGWAGNPVQFLHGNYVLNGDLVGSQTPWTLGTANWAYTLATHLLTRTANADLSTVSQTTKCIPGEKYTVLFTMTRSAGTLTPSLGGTNGTGRAAAGTFREDIICGSTAGAYLTFTPDSAFAGTIDLIWVGKSLEFQPYTSETECATYCGSVPSAGDTKHALNTGAVNNALLGSPSVLMIVDMLGVYPSVKSNTAVIQEFTNWTRLRNGQFLGNADGWTLGSNWAYGTNGVTRTTAADTATLAQNTIDILANVPYNVKFTISGASGVGTVTPSLGGVNGTARTADGTYEETITPTTTTGNLVFTPTNNNWGGKITDVKVIPKIPRYTDGVGVKAFVSTAFDTLPGANAQTMSLTYRNTVAATELAVDNCDAITGWTDSADMTVSANTTNYREGVGGLNLTKDGTAAALASTVKTTTSRSAVNRKLEFWYYCINATAYAKLAAAGALIVRWGSDSSNYYQWSFANTALLGTSATGAGWQYIECNPLTPTTTTGTPDTANMDYTYIGLTATTTGTVWSAGDFVIDDIHTNAQGSQLGQTIANTASSIAGHILHSGAAANNVGPFLPLLAGDVGMVKAENVTLSAASAAAGAFNLVLCKPLIEVPLPVGFVMTERDLLNQLPSLPQLKDGACLGYILFLGAITAAGTQYMGFIDWAWS